MQCPVDSSVLVMSERSGVEIDYCPQCRGVWLDRGELDKILDRADSQLPAEPQRSHPQAEPQRGGFPSASGVPGVSSQDYNRGYGSGDAYKRRKKENWLSELFD